MTPAQVEALLEVDATLRVYLEELDADGEDYAAVQVREDLARLRSAFPEGIDWVEVEGA